MRFANPDMVVQAGATITVQNQDTLPHTVTSEAAPNAFQPSGAFDTGVIAGGGSATFTIPASAVSGTVLYYYCAIHTALMSPPNGMITVQ
jgi:plastocyanin